MRKAGLMIMMIVLQACATPSKGVRPLRLHELATAPYQEVVTAALAGSLTYEGNCLLFRDDQTRGYLMPVWPIGSTFNGTAVLFHRPGKSDQRIMVSEEFLMEGQPVPWSTLGSPSYQPFHNECGAQPFFVTAVRPAN